MKGIPYSESKIDCIFEDFFQNLSKDDNLTKSIEYFNYLSSIFEHC